MYFVDDIERSLNDCETQNHDCSIFRAANLHSTRNKGNIKDEQGIFGLFCARHEVPLYFMDMYTGERYGYLDALLAKLLKDYGENRRIHLFYDISCKYSVNFNVCTSF